MTNILFTCAGRRNYLLQYFKEAMNSRGRIIAADMQITAPAMAIADKAILVPPVDADNYINIILDICRSEKIDAIFSLNDLELPVLSVAKSSFESLGVKVVISNAKAIDICFDKWQTITFEKVFGFNYPQTFINLQEAQKAIEDGSLSFPLVVKPRWGSASIGLEFPENRRELELAYELLSLRLFRSSLAEVSRQDEAHAILIQQKIEGIEYGMDVLNDFTGKPQQVYVKEKLAMRAGETDKSVLRNKPEIEAIGYKIGEALEHIGNLDCDIFEKDGKFFLIEMNPRFGGGYPFTHMSGANYPEALIAWINGLSYDFKNFKKNYNQVYAKCDYLIPVKSEL